MKTKFSVPIYLLRRLIAATTCEQIYSQAAADKTELLIPSVSSSPVIDPHLSPDGTKLAYVRDNELHVLNLLYNTSKQLTEGANENTIVSIMSYSFDLVCLSVMHAILHNIFLLVPIACFILSVIYLCLTWKLFISVVNYIILT